MNTLLGGRGGLCVLREGGVLAGDGGSGITAKKEKGARELSPKCFQNHLH